MIDFDLSELYPKDPKVDDKLIEQEVEWGGRLFNLQWLYCNLCQTATLYCPKCGNNGCNGGAGEINGERCDFCMTAYRIEKNLNDPTYEDFVRYGKKVQKRVDNSLTL